MLKKISRFLFIVLFLSAPAPVHSEIFKWVDGEGKTYFTDDYLKVPTEYRDQTEIRKPSPKAVEKEASQPATDVVREAPRKVEEKEASPQDSQPIEDKERITFLEKIVPMADSEGNAVFAGKIKNNGKEILTSMEIVFTLEGALGQMLGTAKSSVDGKATGVLEGEETGTFEVKTKVPINSIGAYNYNVAWKGFAKE